MILLTHISSFINPRSVVIYTFFCCVIIFCYKIFSLPIIQSHQGDGTFQNLSRRAGPFPIPGYSISMPKFDLGEPKKVEYSMRNLPSIGRKCTAYLAICTSDENWRSILINRLHARLHLESIDSNKKIIIRTDGNLSEYNAYSSSEHNFIALYRQSDEFSFVPDANENYILRLSYNPDPKLHGYQAFVYLECGGIK